MMRRVVVLLEKMIIMLFKSSFIFVKKKKGRMCGISTNDAYEITVDLLSYTLVFVIKYLILVNNKILPLNTSTSTHR